MTTVVNSIQQILALVQKLESRIKELECDKARLISQNAEAYETILGVVRQRDEAIEKLRSWGYIEDANTQLRFAQQKLATMPCGHPAVCVVSSDEGTHYCGWCADKAQRR